LNDTILTHLYGNNRTVDTSAMIAKYQLMNAYWEDKEATQFIESTTINDVDKEKICHLNAGRLLRL